MECILYLYTRKYIKDSASVGLFKDREKGYVFGCCWKVREHLLISETSKKQKCRSLRYLETTVYYKYCNNIRASLHTEQHFEL
jgi:hypothetical protein